MLLLVRTVSTCTPAANGSGSTTTTTTSSSTTMILCAACIWEGPGTAIEGKCYIVGCLHDTQSILFLTFFLFWMRTESIMVRPQVGSGILSRSCWFCCFSYFSCLFLSHIDAFIVIIELLPCCRVACFVRSVVLLPLWVFRMLLFVVDCRCVDCTCFIPSTLLDFFVFDGRFCTVY